MNNLRTHMLNDFQKMIDDNMEKICQTIATKYGDGGDSFTCLDLLKEINKEIPVVNGRIDNDVNDTNNKKKEKLEIKEVSRKENNGKKIKKKKDVKEVKEVKQDVKEVKLVKPDVEEVKQVKHDVEEVKHEDSKVTYNTEKCMARVWGDGHGAQCTKSKKDSEFCGMHKKKFDASPAYHLGRIDEIRPVYDCRKEGQVKIGWKYCPKVEVTNDVKIVKNDKHNKKEKKEKIDELEDNLDKKHIIIDEKQDDVELEKDSYDSDEDEEVNNNYNPGSDEIEAVEVEIDGKDYYLDKQTNKVYSIDGDNDCLGVYNDESGMIEPL